MPPSTLANRRHPTRTALRAAAVLAVAAVACVGPPRRGADPVVAAPRALPPTTNAPEVCSPGWLREMAGQSGGVSSYREGAPDRARAAGGAAEWVEATQPVGAVADSAVAQFGPGIAGPVPASGAVGLSNQPSQEPSSRYPNDPYFRLYQQNGLMLLGALDAWDTSRGGSDVTVAVISTGVQYGHPDLSSKIWRNDDEIGGNGLDDDRNGYVDDILGWNFPADTNDPMDIPKGRGTMMAGIIGAATNNDEGIAGTSWARASCP